MVDPFLVVGLKLYQRRREPDVQGYQVAGRCESAQPVQFALDTVHLGHTLLDKLRQNRSTVNCIHE